MFISSSEQFLHGKVQDECIEIEMDQSKKRLPDSSREECKPKAIVSTMLASQVTEEGIAKIRVIRDWFDEPIPVITLIRTDTTLDLSQKARMDVGIISSE
ncbi:hypothetical protein O181_035909 [Austropuccinia psidii MF-1]|uniref:Uncharacterized protein n=1 Tax=Austropuccinia psidii MF-1 TaxID=1389203 RepID=A0A9Q3HB07_9BASI|nr:hypothetical protein [Austropuccinia psidii MF-1]